MHTAIERLFNEPDDFALTDRLFLCIAERSASDQQLSKLPEEHRVVLQVTDVQGIVGNGGFQYLFEHDLAFESMPEAFEAIGLTSVANAIRAAFVIFPDSVPYRDIGKRLAHIQKPERRQHLLEMSERIWCAKRQIQRKLAAYVRERQDVFSDLVPPPNAEWAEQKDETPEPVPHSTPKSVARWILDCDGEVDIETNPGDVARIFFAHKLPSDEFSLAGFRLAPHRNNTNEELSMLTQVRALRGVNSIDLEETYVSSVGLKSLRQWPSLRALSLAHTDITDEHMQLLQGFSKLDKLNVSRTTITDEGLKHVRHFKKLRCLDLSRTNVSDEGLDRLASLLHLKVLLLNHTQVSGVGLRTLKTAGIRELYVVDTFVDDIGLTSITDLNQLKTLDLERTHITEKGLAQLERLVELDYLSMNYTEVGNSSLKHIAKLKTLTHLGLWGTNVTSRGIRQLSPLKNLKTLEVDDDEIDIDAIDKLKREIPGLEVNR